MAFIEATNIDTIRIEVLGESRAVRATGGQWVDFRENAINFNKELEETADKLSDCWLLLDELARQGSTKAEQLLKKHKCPGWKEPS